MAPILDPVNFFWVFSLLRHCVVIRNIWNCLGVSEEPFIFYIYKTAKTRVLSFNCVKVSKWRNGWAELERILNMSEEQFGAELAMHGEDYGQVSEEDEGDGEEDDDDENEEDDDDEVDVQDEEDQEEGDESGEGEQVEEEEDGEEEEEQVEEEEEQVEEEKEEGEEEGGLLWIK